VDRVARWNSLLELLAAEGGLSIDDAAERLRVSGATIRRDLDGLAQQQLLTRTRGGALPSDVTYDLPLRDKTARHAAEKQQIATAAAGLVSPGDVVGLNGGTTTTEVARALSRRSDLQSSDGTGITLVTNALNIAHELAVRPNIKIVVTGGVARPQSYELIGPLATRLLGELKLDIAILGVDALDAATGASAHHEGEASINSLMASRARRLVVVADGSKLGRTAFALIAPTDQVDVVVTDASAEDDDVKAIEALGVRVIRA
jgi:DeoR family transcriptional regulator of aga operon